MKVGSRFEVGSTSAMNCISRPTVSLDLDFVEDHARWTIPDKSPLLSLVDGAESTAGLMDDNTRKVHLVHHLVVHTKCLNREVNFLVLVLIWTIF